MTLHCRTTERLESAGVDLPTVTIEYNRLSYEADATVGSASMPTLLNTVKAALKVKAPDNTLFAIEQGLSAACLAL
jgi:hypothetical protein